MRTRAKIRQGKDISAFARGEPAKVYIVERSFNLSTDDRKDRIDFGYLDTLAGMSQPSCGCVLLNQIGVAG